MCLFGPFGSGRQSQGLGRDVKAQMGKWGTRAPGYEGVAKRVEVRSGCRCGGGCVVAYGYGLWCDRVRRNGTKRVSLPGLVVASVLSEPFLVPSSVPQVPKPPKYRQVH